MLLYSTMYLCKQNTSCSSSSPFSFEGQKDNPTDTILEQNPGLEPQYTILCKPHLPWCLVGMCQEFQQYKLNTEEENTCKFKGPYLWLSVDFLKHTVSLIYCFISGHAFQSCLFGF